MTWAFYIKHAGSRERLTHEAGMPFAKRGDIIDY